MSTAELRPNTHSLCRYVTEACCAPGPRPPAFVSLEAAVEEVTEKRHPNVHVRADHFPFWRLKNAVRPLPRFGTRFGEGKFLHPRKLCCLEDAMWRRMVRRSRKRATNSVSWLGSRDRDWLRQISSVRGSSCAQQGMDSEECWPRIDRLQE